MPTIHTGHRKRLKTRYEKEGLANFQPHEVLELLLFYSIPQRDVNPLAHRLIDRFGSLLNVLAASPQELMTVEGVGEKTAAWLNKLPEILNAYKSQSLSNRPLLSTLANISDYCTRMHMGKNTEQTWLYAMNMTGFLIHSAQLAEVKMPPARVLAKTIADHAIRYRAQCFVLVEHRPMERMSVSKDEIALTEYVSEALLSIRIPMVDYLLICGRRVESMRQLNILYPDSGQLLNERAQETVFDTWL